MFIFPAEKETDGEAFRKITSVLEGSAIFTARSVRQLSTSFYHSMNRCFSTLGCVELDLSQIVDLATRFGIHHLEIRGIAGRLDLPEYFRGRSDESLRLLEENKIKIRVLGSSSKMVGVRGEEGMEDLYSFSELADRLNAPYVRVFSGGEIGEFPSESDFEQGASRLVRWHEEKKMRGWRCELIMETHHGLSSAEKCLKLISLAGTPVWILWDTYHTFVDGKENLQKTWNELRPYVRHIHFKDFIASPEGRQPYRYVLPGQGEMPLAELVAMLHTDGYTGALSLEWERQWHKELPSLEEALHAAAFLSWWQV
jgi:sugar phosphate isomerase/epimerase